MYVCVSGDSPLRDEPLSFFVYSRQGPAPLCKTAVTSAEVSAPSPSPLSPVQAYLKRRLQLQQQQQRTTYATRKTSRRRARRLLPTGRRTHSDGAQRLTRPGEVSSVSGPA